MAFLSAVSFPEEGHGGGYGSAVKVLREIIACIKIFTPVEGLKPFPWALNSDGECITVRLRQWQPPKVRENGEAST